jgi:hypothetical protein
VATGCRHLVLALPVVLVASVLGSVPPSALAWGKAGHRVVATLAMSLLTPEARAQVTDLLGPNVTLAEIATWADEVRTSRPNTGPWHYVNIPREATTHNAARDCARGCVVSAIEQSLRLLQDASKDRAVREEALRWVVHFVADLHQPLHALAEDRGGNDVLSPFMVRQTNLHRLWDGDLRPCLPECDGAVQAGAGGATGGRSGKRGTAVGLLTAPRKRIAWHWRPSTRSTTLG